jgi:peptidyl-dipeptidase A
MMSLGSSQPWGKALQILTGSSYYDVKPLLQYYEPIHRWLQAEIKQYNIPVGWE